MKIKNLLSGTRTLRHALCLALTPLLICGLNLEAAPKRVLVVTTTLGFRHSSIPTAEKVIGELAESSKDFTVEYARVEPNDPQYKGADGKPDKSKYGPEIAKVLAEKMSPEALKNYDAVIFANTTGDLPLPDPPEISILEFVNSESNGSNFSNAPEPLRKSTLGSVVPVHAP